MNISETGWHTAVWLKKKKRKLTYIILCIYLCEKSASFMMVETVSVFQPRHVLNFRTG